MTNPAPPGPQGNYGTQGNYQPAQGGYPPQGGYPQQQGGAVPPPPPGGFGQQMPPVAPKKKRGKARGILAIIAVIVVAIIGIFAWIGSKSDPDAAKVGSCMQGQDANSLKTVDCAKTYDWKVVGKVDNKTQSDFDISGSKLCDAYPTATASFWKGEKGGKGYVLCLEPKQ